MRILLDECVNTKLKREFVGHEVRTVHDERLNGLKNGKLLKRASELGFEAFVTIDKNLSSQQNLQQVNLSVVLLDSKSSSLDSLKPLVTKLLKQISHLRSGEINVIK